MFNIHPRQARSIAILLETSRLHFGLPPRRRISRSPRLHLQRTILRLALVAGSIGSLFSGPAFAEHDYRYTRTQTRTSSTTAPASGGELQARSSIERMP